MRNIETPNEPGYSKEKYLEIEKTLEVIQSRLDGLAIPRAETAASLEDSRQIYSRTHSHTRRTEIERAENKLARMDDVISGKQEIYNEIKLELVALLKLAQEEAEIEDEAFNKARLQKRYEKVTKLEGQLDHFDPDQIPSAEELSEIQTQYDAELRGLVDDVAEHFRKLEDQNK